MARIARLEGVQWIVPTRVGWEVGVPTWMEGSFVHAGCRAGHGVLVAGLPVVCGTRSGAGLAHVVVVNIAAVGVAVVPILEAFVGSGLHHEALTAAG